MRTRDAWDRGRGQLDKQTTPAQIFEEYRQGVRFKNALGKRGLYEQNRINERFYAGDQWYGARCSEDRPLVRHNVIRRIGDYKMAMVGAAPVAVSRRQALYARLGGGEKALTAEAIYRAFRRERPSPYERATLAREFLQDDHSLWDQKGTQENEDQWQRAAQRVQTSMETVFSQNAAGGEAVLEQLRVEAREKHNYRAFLQRFAVLGEELGVDADAFDYGYYAYGLRRYGNMPLIEPLETRETRRVRDLVIAIDTSMSTSGELVREFLSYTILKESESFFRTFRLRLLQCDDQLRSDQLITNEEELKAAMEHFQLTGQSATDFRPVFEHVDGLIRKGELRDLRGLLYFTDGLGIYPARRPAYDAAFVMLSQQGFPERVPPWGIRVLLDEDELIQEDTYPDTLSEEEDP